MTNYARSTSVATGEGMESWPCWQSNNLQSKSPQLLLQCENGTIVPLSVVPGPGNATNVELLVPDTRCGFGVLSFPKPFDASANPRTSLISTTDKLSNAFWERKRSPSQDSQLPSSTTCVEKHRTHGTLTTTHPSRVSGESSAANGKPKKVISSRLCFFSPPNDDTRTSYMQMSPTLLPSRRNTTIVRHRQVSGRTPVKRNTAHTGSVLENATIFSRDVATSMRCQTYKR